MNREVRLRAAPYGVLALLTVALAWPILSTPGLPYNVDLSGFFPLTPEAYANRFWPLWNERGGMSTAQFLPALLLELPFFLAGGLLGWDMGVHIKLRIVFGFLVAAFGAYALTRHYLHREGSPKRSDDWTLVLIPLAAALFYAFNPWSVHRVFHYFLWLGYVFAPLVLLALERLREKPTPRRALTLAVVFALATTDPHNPFNLALLLVPVGALRLAQTLRRDRREARRLTGMVAASAAAYLLLGAYWILPYLYNALHNPSFGPTYVMSHEMLATLSGGADWGTVLRNLHNYYPRHPLEPEGATTHALWTAAGYALPLLAAHALIVRRATGTSILYAGIALTTMLLGMGDRPPFTDAYRWALFHAPWGEGLSWLFRDPYRWGGHQALATAVLLTFTLEGLRPHATFAGRRIRGALRVGGPALALTAVALFSAPALHGYVTEVYAPVVVPDEYAAGNVHLAATPEDHQVLWMPRMLGATTWGGHRTLEFFDATSSARSAFGPFRPHTSTYFNFIEDTALQGAPLTPLLSRIGTDEVLFHNDRAPERDARVIQRLQEAGLQPRGVLGETPTQAVAASSVSVPYTPGARYPLHGDHVLQQTLAPDWGTLTELTLRMKVVGEPGPLQVTLLGPEDRVLIHHNVTPAPGSGDVTLPLQGTTALPGLPHTLLLRTDAARSDVDNRYDVSYYKVDAYAHGRLATSTTGGATWTSAPGDLYFDLLATVPGFLHVLENPNPSPLLRTANVTPASPDGLDLLRTLALLPANNTLDAAGVLFTHASPTAREAFARNNASWHWVTDLTAGRLETVVPFLPQDAFVAPFKATVSADHHDGWARGTREFMYYEWGWRIALWEHRQKSWDFDGDQGLAYTDADSDLTLETPAADRDAPRVLLARVHQNPGGGPLTFLADGREVATLDTTAADGTPGFTWVRIGDLKAGERTVTLRNGDGLQGVNLLAVVPEDAYAEALADRDARFQDLPVTLLAEAEDLQQDGPAPVVFPSIGKLARIQAPLDTTFHLPADARPDVWLRIPQGDAAPGVEIDGAPLGDARCVAECDAPAPWYAVAAGALTEGPHRLTLTPPASGEARVDALLVTTAPQSLLPDTGDAPQTRWERVDPTTYRATVDATDPFQLVLAQPYDSGWRLRIEETGETLRSIPGDGVTNAFFVPATGPVTLTLDYAPHGWAETGAWVTGTTAILLVLLLGASRLRRTRVAPRTLDLPLLHKVFR